MSMNVLRFTFGVVAVAGAAMMAGCGGSSTPSSPTAPSTPAAPAAPTFSQIQAQILTPSCVSCHTDDARAPAGTMNLRPGSAHASLVGVASSGKPGAVRVIAGNPSGSYLVQKLEGAADIVGLRMPRNATPLSDAQVAMIRQWIQAGAPNN
jgi:cytochrome c553